MTSRAHRGRNIAHTRASSLSAAPCMHMGQTAPYLWSMPRPHPRPPEERRKTLSCRKRVVVACFLSRIWPTYGHETASGRESEIENQQQEQNKQTTQKRRHKSRDEKEGVLCSYICFFLQLLTPSFSLHFSLSLPLFTSLSHLFSFLFFPLFLPFSFSPSPFFLSLSLRRSTSLHQHPPV